MYSFKFDKFSFSRHIDEHPSSKNFDRHTHNEYEMLCFFEGEANYNVEGKISRLQAGDVVIIPTGAYHNLSLLADCKYDRLLFYFDRDILPLEIMDKLDSLPFVISTSEYSRISNIFSRVNYYSTVYPQSDVEILVENLLKELIINLTHIADNTTYKHEYNATVGKIIQYVADHVREKIELEDIASHLYLSKSHIQNIFCEYMGIGLKSYIITKKIYQAQQLINSGVKAGDVCAICGFNDYSSFYRAYRKVLGITPTKSK
ncbi:MAG: helix-turn-helix domain-containing protein [Clostridia bacterium]|nr:helix-turn-helix domain-containing protein [Clostridia bacterium]